MPLHALAQPFARHHGLSGREMHVEIGQVGTQRRVQAAGIDIAEAVGREIAEKPDRPVHILQHPLRGARDRMAEIGGEPVVPGRFQIAHREVARNERALQIEAQHDMEVILHLVGLGADMAGMHAVDRPIECLLVGKAEIAESLHHPPEKPAAEGPAAAKLVLVDPALAFVHAHRDPLPQRREPVIGVDPLLVAGMAGLVDRGIEAVERVALAHPRGDAHIVARAGGERMHRQIEPSAREIIAEAARHLARKAHLRLMREMSRDLGPIRPKRRTAQFHQPRPHLGKEPLERLRRHPRLIFVQKRVIAIAAIGERRRFLSLELQNLGQGRREGGDIVGGARLGPDPLRPACQPRQRHRQGGGHARRALVIAADEAQFGPGLRILGVGFLLRLGQKMAARGIGAPLVQHRLHRAHLLGALLGRAARHHRLLVPAQTARHLRQRRAFALARHQIVMGRHVIPPGWIARADKGSGTARAGQAPRARPPRTDARSPDARARCRAPS